MPVPPNRYSAVNVEHIGIKINVVVRLDSAQRSASPGDDVICIEHQRLRYQAIFSQGYDTPAIRTAAARPAITPRRGGGDAATDDEMATALRLAVDAITVGSSPTTAVPQGRSSASSASMASRTPLPSPVRRAPRHRARSPAAAARGC